MIHHRQRLPLGLKASDDLASIHARFDDLQRDPSLNWLLLLGHVHDTHAPFAHLLEQFVGADPGAGFFGDGPVDGGAESGWRFEETPCFPIALKEIFDFLVQRYGEFALYRPRASGKTLVLWLAPALLLLGGAFALWRIVTRRMALPIDDEESEA